MVEVGKLYRIKGSIPIRTNDGYIMGAYAYVPRYIFYQKNTLSDIQPLVEDGTIVIVVDIPKDEIGKRNIGVHVLIGERIHYILASNLEAL